MHNKKPSENLGGLDFTGADDRIRTYDLLITNELLYQLSYISATNRNYYSAPEHSCQHIFVAYARSKASIDAYASSRIKALHAFIKFYAGKKNILYRDQMLKNIFSNVEIYQLISLKNALCATSVRLVCD